MTKSIGIWTLCLYIAFTTGWTFASIQATVRRDTAEARWQAFQKSGVIAAYIRSQRKAHRVTDHHVYLLVTAYDIDPHREPGAPCTRFPGKTATGVQVHVGSVAVDPRVFPMGTRFSIPGYGDGVADDTGGWIHGHHIDIAIRGCKRALDWGARRFIADVAPSR